MTIIPITTYVRRYRLKSGLSQDEVAFLLGIVYGTGVGRHERCQQVPTLDTAIAYAIIFGIPVAEVFPQNHHLLAVQITKRAKHLLRRVRAEGSSVRRAHKVASIRSILSREGGNRMNS